MFTQILTATDRDGRVLERRTVKAPNRIAAFDEIGKAYSAIKKTWPLCYIFTESHEGG